MPKPSKWIARIGVIIVLVGLSGGILAGRADFLSWGPSALRLLSFVDDKGWLSLDGNARITWYNDFEDDSTLRLSIPGGWLTVGYRLPERVEAGWAESAATEPYVYLIDLADGTPVHVLTRDKDVVQQLRSFDSATYPARYRTLWRSMVYLAGEEYHHGLALESNHGFNLFIPFGLLEIALALPAAPFMGVWIIRKFLMFHGLTLVGILIIINHSHRLEAAKPKADMKQAR